MSLKSKIKEKVLGASEKIGGAEIDPEDFKRGAGYASEQAKKGAEYAARGAEYAAEKGKEKVSEWADWLKEKRETRTAEKAEEESYWSEAAAEMEREYAQKMGRRMPPSLRKGLAKKIKQQAQSEFKTREEAAKMGIPGTTTRYTKLVERTPEGGWITRMVPETVQKSTADIRAETLQRKALETQAKRALKEAGGGGIVSRVAGTAFSMAEGASGSSLLRPSAPRAGGRRLTPSAIVGGGSETMDLYRPRFSAPPAPRVSPVPGYGLEGMRGLTVPRRSPPSGIPKPLNPTRMRRPRLF